MTALTLAETLDMDRDTWLEMRKMGIGGSDAAVVCGLSKWKSPVELWLEKRGEYQPEEPGEAAYWGTVLEDIVAKEFELRTGLKVKLDNRILKHHEYPFMLANIDRQIVGKNEILEVKTANAYLAKEWEDDRLPDSYYCQAQHYCAVTGAEGVHFAVLIGGQKFVTNYVPRNDEFIAKLIEIETDFWRKVETGERPAIDGSTVSAELLDNLFPHSNGEEIALPVSAVDLIQEYQDAKAQLDAAEFKKQVAENALKELLGEAELGTIQGYKVEWKSTKPKKTFDSKKLEKERPEIYQQYAGLGNPSRRFTIKGGM